MQGRDAIVTALLEARADTGADGAGVGVSARWTRGAAGGRAAAGCPPADRADVAFHLEAQIFEVLWDALLWGGLSGCFVSGYICFHTKSLFLTLLGQAGIWIISVTWFIYRVFFGIKYFGMPTS